MNVITVSALLRDVDDNGLLDPHVQLLDWHIPTDMRVDSANQRIVRVL